MIHPQLLLDLHDELIVDNFAGGGGASTGIEMALGRRVDIAINHDGEAVRMHEVNHPETRHYREDVWEVDPRVVCDGRPVGLLWLSPDCKHFSRAKGGTPVNKNIRGLAWVALRWAATVRPRVIMLENVAEWLDWGPVVVGPDGQLRPCPKRKGRTFASFCNAFRRHGYELDYRKIRACDHGAPTIRERVFLIARCDGRPIVWPEPTHGDPASDAVRKRLRKPWRTAAEIIDWSLPCPSIFERKRPLADNTLRRIANGVMRYVVDAQEPFIVTNTTGHPGAPLSAPLRTITTGGHHALVIPHVSRQFGQGIGRDLNEPFPTVMPGGMGKSALVAAFLAKHYTGVVGAPLARPTPTVTARDHNALVTSHLVKLRGTSQHGQDVRDPLHTISAGGTHFAEVRAFLIKYFGTDQDPRLREPLHTVTTKDRFGLVTVAGEVHRIVDIGMRMLTPRELYRAQGFPENYIIGDDPAQGLKLTKQAQVRLCGNSVSPPPARALVLANVPELVTAKVWR